MVSKLTVKKLSSLTFVAMLVLSAIILFEVHPALAEVPYIGVYPPHTDNKKTPDTFTVKINVSSTVPFTGYQIYLYWNRTYINATSMTETPPATWSPFYAGPGIQWNFNATHGRISRAVLDTALHTVTGTYQVMTITFKVILDSSPPTVVAFDLDPDDSFLSDAVGDPISPCDVVDGDVTVIPEFPIFLIIPLFIALTFAAVILGKKSFLKTRRSSFVAN